MSLEEVPDEVLRAILQQLDQQQRLCKCSLVQARWQRAAAAATKSIKASLAPWQVHALQLWLQQYGQNLIKLDLASSGRARHAGMLHELPCCQLQQLRLCTLQLQLESGSGYEGLLHRCNAVHELSMTSCIILDGPDSLTALARLSSLQHLSLEWLTTWDAETGHEENIVMPGCLLQQLVQLTHLSLQRAADTRDKLQHLSCLTGLRELHLADNSPLGLDALPGLSQLQQLTQLSLSRAFALTLSTSSTPGLHQLTGLQYLSLEACQGVEPAVLSSLQQLQHLSLVNTPIAGGTTGVAVLLAWMQQLQHLQHLDISGSLTSHAPTAEAYAALTASSLLQNLSLSGCSLPCGVWKHMFPSNRHLPELHTTLMCVSQPAAAAVRMDDEDLDRLVQCCPRLNSLDVVRTVQQDVQMTALLKLSGLQRLSISCVSNEAAGVLGQLTGLLCLTITKPSSLDVGGLLQLAALKQLQRLYVHGQFSEQLKSNTASSPYVFLVNKAPDNEPADVWSQLLECIHLTSHRGGSHVAAYKHQSSAHQPG